uniref:Rps2 n=1 Tax=Laurentiella strenua TaxID=114681 RepID=A0A2I4PES1_9SPIT|nr:rps2 [Laurentiella strenua]
MVLYKKNYSFLDNFFFLFYFYKHVVLMDFFFFKNFLKLKLKFSFLTEYKNFKNLDNLQKYQPSKFFLNQFLNGEFGNKIKFDNFKILLPEYKNTNTSNFVFNSLYYNQIFYKFLNLFFFFNYSIYNSRFKKAGFAKFFYINSLNDRLHIINLAKFTNRWCDGYNLLFNVYFHDFHPLIYASPLFKNETLSLNWFYNNWDINFWRYYFSFFIFKISKYNHKINYFYERLKDNYNNFTIVTDCVYHFKNLYYLKKNHIYTIGLLDISTNPWIVEYPIISFSDSYLTQLFFFKLLVFLNKSALQLKYSFLQKLWFYTFLYKKF